MRCDLRTMLGVAVIGLATHAYAQVTFYRGEVFRGRSVTVENAVPNFAAFEFDDRARSAIVEHGRWEVCEDAGFEGRCVILGPGTYESLSEVGMFQKVSSVRPAEQHARYDTSETLAAPTYRYYQRPSEPLYQAQVTSVHAVVGPPERRCWIERQQVQEEHGSVNVPGAVVGAVIGGVLGHQIGGGRGRDVATAGGAMAGAAIGASVGREGGAYGRDVRRCATVSGNARPEYWDVKYDFRGIEHRAQLSAPPGPTIVVNADGEPRG